MNVSLESLPSELLGEVSDELSPEDLKSMRLSSKSLCSAATRSLFHHLKLFPTKLSQETFLQVLSSLSLSRYVRHVHLCTEESSKGIIEEEPGLSKEFIEAFMKTTEFPNLTTITLVFQKFRWNRSGRNRNRVYAKSLKIRTEALNMLLDMLNDPSKPQGRNICNLSIKGRVDNDPMIISSPKFVTLLNRLRKLRLFTTNTQDITTNLPSVWLEPTAAKLTHLSIYMGPYFGYTYKLDLREIRFPNLRSLGFGQYVFSHDWQFDWIIRHSKTLQQLTLDDCPILFLARNCRSLDSEGYPQFMTGPPIFDDRLDNTYTYSRRWSEVFERFRMELGALRSICFGCSTLYGEPIDDVVSILEYKKTYPKPYQAFKIGFNQRLQVDWIALNFLWEKGRCAESQHKWDEKDTVALFALMRSIGQPIPAGFHPR